VRFFVAVLGSCAALVGLVIACSHDDSNAPGGPSTDAATTTPDDDAGEGALDSGGPPDTRILPLALGRKWMYSVHVFDGGTPCPGDPSAEVLGEGTVRDAGPTLRYRSLCLETNRYAAVEVAGTGDKLVAYGVSDAGTVLFGPKLYLDAPVEEGHQWNYDPGVVFEWVDAGTVTVPAGTFHECWKRAQLQPTEPGYVTYCRGVGQVRHTFADYEAELTSKNF
jgi:hypothetical protein